MKHIIAFQLIFICSFSYTQNFQINKMEEIGTIYQRCNIKQILSKQITT